MSQLTVRVFDGSRQPFSTPGPFLITILDGNNQLQFRQDVAEPVKTFDLPFFDNFGDNYTVLVYRNGYRQAGFQPVVLSNSLPTTLDLMLVPKNPGFNFVDAQWPAVSQAYPFLAGDVDPATARGRYEDLLERQPTVLACLLNLCAAMSQIQLSAGTPLTYIQQIRWDEPPAQDRFFAFCDTRLVEQVQLAAAQKLFAPEPNPGLLHPGATRSWKQVRFGEANVQLTFHENAPDHKTINGIDCVTLEPDIDYYKSLESHIILEVLPNALSHTLTNPIEVYILRWIAGRRAGTPDFSPLYTLTA